MLSDLDITPEALATVIKQVANGKINRGAGKKVLIAVIEDKVDPMEFIKKNKLDAKVDEGAITAVIEKVIAANEAAVADYKSGKEKALQAIFGACMRELKGAGDPAMIKAMLEQKLKA